MTTIAYKNGFIAADKLAGFSGMGQRVTKITKHNGMLIGASGYLAQAATLIEWIKNGMNKEDFPVDQTGDERNCSCMVIKDSKIFLIMTTPVLVELEEDFFAIGSGRDFAISAMHFGKSAKEAVEFASIYDTNTGLGVDVLNIESKYRYGMAAQSVPDRFYPSHLTK